MHVANDTREYPEEMPEALFTTSWDDGHPLDLRIAELLTKHGFSGTFYVPLRNPASRYEPEGLPVLSTEDLRKVGTAFEIGSHTLDHAYLDELRLSETRRQIVDGKIRLEDRLGRAVMGFCYPGGRCSEALSRIVRDAGFGFARTIVNLRSSVSGDPYFMPTTIQFFPHGRDIYLKNFIKFGQYSRRASLFFLAMRSAGLKSRLEAMLDNVCAAGGVFHLWGHSWEIERINGWSLLDSFLGYAADRVPHENRVCNGALLGFQQVKTGL